MFSVFMTG